MAAEPALRSAVVDLAWLLDRGYSDRSALKLVGDRYALRARQRVAVRRCCCTDAERVDRWSRRVDGVFGRPLWIDGFNLLTTVEAALAGGVLLRGRDGCLRDMASMHGQYKRVAETAPAIARVGALLVELDPTEVRWLLDRPVSNSGRLATALRAAADAAGWPWTVDLVPDPDRLLVETDAVVASADAAVLDGCGAWLELAGRVVGDLDAVWCLDLESPTAPDRV